MLLLPPTVARRDLPQLRAVAQHFPRPRQADVGSVAYVEAAARLHEIGPAPGARVAIGVGSRGIRDIVTVVKATVAACCDAGLTSFVASAMGSHGGGATVQLSRSA